MDIEVSMYDDCVAAKDGLGDTKSRSSKCIPATDGQKHLSTLLTQCQMPDLCYHGFASIPSGGCVSTFPFPTSDQLVLNAVPLLS